jgi:hypothetical protein
MDEISNRTLAILLIAAIVISLGGTLISLNQLDRLKTISITGMQTYNESLGNVSLLISDVTWINFTVYTCNFGSGFVTAAVCTMNSSPYENVTGCSDNWDPATGCNGALELKNIGNNNVTLNMSWALSQTNFLGSSSAEFWYRMANGTRAGAGAEQGCHRNLINTSWTTVASDNQDITVCDDFAYEQSKGQFVHMHVQVAIPQDATEGYKSNRVTAKGEAI